MSVGFCPFKDSATFSFNRKFLKMEIFEVWKQVEFESEYGEWFDNSENSFA